MRFPDLHSVDLNLLLVLHDLMETRSTTVTAQRLNMSQPAVSRALARLRLLFDDVLLVKGPRGMVPTERALELMPPLADLLRHLEVFLEAPSFTPATTSRVFRLATTDYGAVAVVPALVGQLATTAPQAGLEVAPLGRDVFAALAAGDLDLVLIGDLPVPAPLHVAPLFADDYRGALRRGHPLAEAARADRVDLETYLGFPHVRVSIFDDRTGADEALAAIGRQRAIAAQLPYFGVAAVVAATSDAILTLPRRAMAPLARQQDLITFTPPLAIRGVAYRMVWHERTEADFGARWLRAQVLLAAESGTKGG